VLQEYIVAGTSKDDFQTRLKTVVASPNLNTATVAPSPPPVPAPAPAVRQETQTVGTTATMDHGSNQTQTPVAQYQTHQATNESTERTTRENIRHGKQPEKQVTPEEKKAKQEKEDRRAMQLKIQREQKEQKEERERIRNQIKHDQEARRQRAAEEKGYSSTSFPASQKTTAETTGSNRPGKRQALEYRLQIRLFDGSSVRNSFPPSATIRKDIRPWLESQRSDGSQPYNLKHILTPLPNRTISVSEEERSLEELELGPTASLVMVPVPSYIEAYAPSGIMDSLPARVVSSGYGLVSGVVGGVTGMVGGFLGYGSAPAQQAPTSDSTSNRPSVPTTARNSQKINIRTLHDQWNDQDKNEFYNGNTVRSPSISFP
jgi:UBX domain